MTYFKNIKTLEELRKEYKRLVKQNHPDNGGSEDIIKVINVEYEISFHILEKTDTTSSNKYNMKEDEMLRAVINAIINLNIEIEICGSWVWVSGSTYSCKDDLKSNGFQWASKKKMWFWHDPEAPVKSHVRIRGYKICHNTNVHICIRIEGESPLFFLNIRK